MAQCPGSTHREKKETWSLGEFLYVSRALLHFPLLTLPLSTSAPFRGTSKWHCHGDLNCGIHGHSYLVHSEGRKIKSEHTFHAQRNSSTPQNEGSSSHCPSWELDKFFNQEVHCCKERAWGNIWSITSFNLTSISLLSIQDWFLKTRWTWFSSSESESWVFELKIFPSF